MGRKPIGRRAMTPVERQRRHRKRLRKEKTAHALKIEAARQRQISAEKYIPYPPGITYYEKVSVITPEGEQTIFVPKTRPLAACRDDLEDEDVVALLDQLEKIAKGLGLRKI